MSRHLKNVRRIAFGGALSAISILPVLAGTLAQSPLTVQVGIPSNVMFSLSVEFPTADTAAYQGGNDYTESTTYQGLFDPDKCYDYDTTNEWFNPVSLVTDRNCTGHWGGNMLNWATMTGLDEFRIAMTGGNRYQDTASLTVLERTYQSGLGSFPTKSYVGTRAIPANLYSSSDGIYRLSIRSQGLDRRMTVTRTSTGTLLKEFKVRVKVCDPSIGLEANCKKYGANSYKPIGSIQKYGHLMRFGLFSYYLEDDNDNAVMRSKAKFVAPNKWTPGGQVDNANKEWSDTDGTFVANPDLTEANASYGGAVANSGVINYVNKFGTFGGTITDRTNGGTKFTRYKTFDNVGKLYYETLNYLKGSQAPTQAFYEKSSTANNENFPVITTWDDPVQYACQKNFVIVMGDKNAWCDKRLPGGQFANSGSCGPRNGQASDKGSLPTTNTDIDVGTWTNNLGNLEGRSSLATTGFANNASFYISGLAYWAAFNGFRPKTGSSERMKLQTFIIDVQEGANLGVNSQYWYAAKYGGVARYDNNGAPYDATTTANGNTPTNDSWWTTNPQDPSRKWPKALLPAGNPDLMRKAVEDALQQIASQSASASAVTLSTNRLSGSGGINIFSTSFNSDNWSGDVLSFNIDGLNTFSSTPIWRASATLNPATLNPASGTAPWKTRRIITFNDGLNADGTDNTDANARLGVEFRATNSIGGNDFTTQFSPRQQALLAQDAGTTPSSRGVGPDRVDYLRGDNSNEGNLGEQWRARTSSLGDIIHSSAVYVRKSAFRNIPNADINSFRIYADAIASRTPVVYVGANDGMLHVFNASDNADDGFSASGATANSGREMLAYVPAALYGKLKQLTSPSYNHQYFVDSTPVVADAQLSNCTPSSDTYECWRTIVTGGLKAGGQGVYALDGTDPSRFANGSASSLVLWEFTDRDDPDLGYTFASPIVRKLNNGKWAVIFGNGYNNTEADGMASSDGRAYLYILMLDGPGVDSSGRGQKWTLGTNYFKIKLNAPGETGTTLSPANGLSTVFPVDRNGDGLTDYLYAGDRYGNLWKIDVRDTDPTNWASAFGTVANPQPLFSAVTPDNTPSRQQITTSPLVITNPNGGYTVLFGTGSFNDTEDNATPFSVNSYYGIWDKDDGSTRVTSRSQLQKQITLAHDAATGFSLQSNCAVQYSATPTSPSQPNLLCPASLAPSTNANGTVNQQLGWVFDLNFSVSASNTGERYISDPLPEITSSLLTFTTLTPSGDICNGSFTDFEYNLDPLTGGGAASPVYYDFANSASTAISINFSYGGQSAGSSPSGKKSLGVGTGQNKGSYIAPAGGSSGSGSGSGNGNNAANGTFGCSNFVAGRPCVSPQQGCSAPDISAKDLSSSKPECNKRVPGSGRIIWRQVTQ